LLNLLYLDLIIISYLQYLTDNHLDMLGCRKLGLALLVLAALASLASCAEQEVPGLYLGSR
jgi:hypothetical protein